MSWYHVGNTSSKRDLLLRKSLEWFHVMITNATLEPPGCLVVIVAEAAQGTYHWN